METKFKIIETDEYFLAISDEDASNSYIYFTGDPNGIFRTGIKYKSGAGDYFYQDAITGMSNTYLAEISKKVIAYQPKGNAPELDLPLLPYVEEDVEKLAFEYDRNRTGKWINWDVKNGFIAGYKKATKVYSEDDVCDFVEWMNLHYRALEHTISFKDATGTKQLLQRWIQSKTPKTPKWFVAEMKHTKSEVFRENDNVPYAVLKTTIINNKNYIVGTYLN
jgi:hypothetical protein